MPKGRGGARGGKAQAGSKKIQQKAVALNKSTSKNSKHSLNPSVRVRPVFNKYVQILQSCDDTKIVGKGAFHVILKDHRLIDKGYYCRIGFMEDTGDEQSFKKNAERRLEWSKALSNKEFCIRSKEAEVHVLSEDERKFLKRGIFNGETNKALLRDFCKNHITEESTFIALYGEFVVSSEKDTHKFLNDLDLRSREDRSTFRNILRSLHNNVSGYVGFVIDHLEKKGWSSFAFDLNTNNALVVKKDGSGNPFTVLCDLDAEEYNCFSSKDKHQYDAEFCKLFVTENWEVLSLAAFIILTLNSIRTLKHPRHDDSDESNNPWKNSASGHDHPSCSDYLVAEEIHNILEKMHRLYSPSKYNEKIVKLFEIMTSHKYWDKSMTLIPHYLADKKEKQVFPGSESAWALSTRDTQAFPAGQKQKTEALTRQRWLLLLFLNIYKCPSCQKPRLWILRDLLNPMWDRLDIKNSFQINFYLSLDLLKRKKLVSVEHNRF